MHRNYINTITAVMNKKPGGKSHRDTSRNRLDAVQKDFEYLTVYNWRNNLRDWEKCKKIVLVPKTLIVLRVTTLCKEK